MNVAPVIVPTTAKKNLPKRGWWRRNSANLIFAAGMALILVILLWSRMVYSIPAGSVGVLWLRFFSGTVTSYHYTEGIHIIFPWDYLYIYDARMQRLDQQIVALSEDGLPVEIQISLTYTITPDQVGHLHKALGPQYPETTITPIVSSQIVLLAASRPAEALYSLGRTEVDTAVISAMRNRAEKLDLNSDATGPLFKLEDINIRRIVLPLPLQRAIEEKLAAKQTVLRYEYINEREKLESQRKTIEAHGIRAFQDIVAPAITESYLKWKGIDATLQLAQSNNSKIVVIGGGSNGLPIILDGVDGGRHQAPASPPGGPAPAASPVVPLDHGSSPFDAPSAPASGLLPPASATPLTAYAAQPPATSPLPSGPVGPSSVPPPSAPAPSPPVGAASATEPPSPAAAKAKAVVPKFIR